MNAPTADEAAARAAAAPPGAARFGLRAHIPLLALVALALLLRGAWVMVRWMQDGAALSYDDERLHWSLARHLAQDATLVSDDGRLAARMPLYPAYLALFAWAGDVGVLLARLGQALLGAASVGLGYSAALALTSRRDAALLTAGLIAVDPYAVFFANLLLNEVLFTTLSVAFAAAGARLLRDPGACWPVVLLGPALVHVRPEAAGWVVLMWGVLGLTSGVSRMRVLRQAVLAATVLLLALAPWALRNHLMLGSTVWLSTNGGVTLFDGQGPQANGGSDQAFLQQAAHLRQLDEVQLDRALGRAAIEQMRSDPQRVLDLAWAKLLRTWSPWPNVAEHRSGWSGAASAVYTLTLLILGVFGAAALLRNRRARGVLLMALPIVYFTVLVCVFIGSVRYRIPLMPFLALLSGAALCWRAGTQAAGR